MTKRQRQEGVRERGRSFVPCSCAVWRVSNFSPLSVPRLGPTNSQPLSKLSTCGCVSLSPPWVLGLPIRPSTGLSLIPLTLARTTHRSLKLILSNFANTHCHVSAFACRAFVSFCVRLSGCGVRVWCCHVFRLGRAVHDLSSSFLAAFA